MAMLKTPGNAGKISPDSIRSQLHLNGNQGDQLDRIVLAGKKVMFSQQSHKLMLDQLQGPGTMGQKLGQGVAGLMALLWQESKRSVPPQLLIPAGMVLVAVAADFLKQAGQDITDQDIAQGIEAMVSALFHAAGVDPEKAAAIGGSAGAKQSSKQPAKPAAKQGVRA
jgi:hypothetical protein